MPVVLRRGAYRFSFFSNENLEPAHVHVTSAGKEAKFWLEPTTILADNGGFRAHEITRIARIIEENRQLLLEKWHEHLNR